MPVVPLTPRQRSVASRSSTSSRSSIEVLQPQAGALADGGELRRLEVGVGEASGWPRCAARSRAARGERRSQPPRAAAAARRAAAMHVGVVGDEGAGGAEVEDAAGAGSSAACSAKWRRWATTSWRVSRSSSATRSRSMRGRRFLERPDLLLGDRQAELALALAPARSRARARCGSGAPGRRSRPSRGWRSVPEAPRTSAKRVTEGSGAPVARSPQPRPRELAQQVAPRASAMTARVLLFGAELGIGAVAAVGREHEVPAEAGRRRAPAVPDGRDRDRRPPPLALPS